MKNLTKLFGLIVFAAVIGFIMPMDLHASGGSDKGGSGGAAAEVNSGGGEPQQPTRVVIDNFRGGRIGVVTYINEWMGMRFKENNEQEFLMNDGSGDYKSGAYKPVTKGTWSTSGNVLTWTDTHKSDDGGRTWTPVPAGQGATWVYEIGNNKLLIDINENGVDPWELIGQW